MPHLLKKKEIGLKLKSIKLLEVMNFNGNTKTRLLYPTKNPTIKLLGPLIHIISF